MILISHRGNTKGKRAELENNPSYVQSAIDSGYEVEIDVWFIGGEWWLGHDNPEHKISIDYFSSKPFWIHAKNLDAISQLNILDKTGIYLNYFWHQEDDVTLTSKGYIWAYPNIKCKNSIAVMPPENYNLEGHIGICSDNIIQYK